MRVFIEVGRKNDESYLLTMSEGTTQREIKHILQTNGYELASRILITKSKEQMLVPSDSRSRARLCADFTVSRGFQTERLG